MAEVLFNSVSKRYPSGVLAVDDFSLQVADREFLVLVGPSGCGKSTLLRMLAGLESVSSGSISIGGEVCDHKSPRERDIAMVFQNYALYPHMTVRENLEFGLKLSRKFSSTEIDIRVEETAEILDIGELLSRKPKQLSGGQKQRVALGRAIVRKPKVFLFDEPLSNLDAKMRIQMRVEIGKLHARLQSTMIYVTHDQTEAMTMGDRIVCMKDGKALQVSTPMQIYGNPVNEYVAGFIGTPPMNIIAGEMDATKEHFLPHGVKQSLSIPLGYRECLQPGAMVHLGIRPEHIEQVAQAEDSFKVYVEVVEPLGAETLVYASYGAGSVVYKVSPHSAPMVGDELFVRPKADNLHFFDPNTGQAIC